jgi:hypothetical protein
LNPSGAALLTAAVTPHEQGYDTRSILFLPNLNDDLT